VTTEAASVVKTTSAKYTHRSGFGHFQLKEAPMSLLGTLGQGLAQRWPLLAEGQLGHPFSQLLHLQPDPGNFSMMTRAAPRKTSAPWIATWRTLVAITASRAPHPGSNGEAIPFTAECLVETPRSRPASGEQDDEDEYRDDEEAARNHIPQGRDIAMEEEVSPGVVLAAVSD